MSESRRTMSLWSSRTAHLSGSRSGLQCMPYRRCRRSRSCSPGTRRSSDAVPLVLVPRAGSPVRVLVLFSLLRPCRTSAFVADADAHGRFRDSDARTLARVLTVVAQPIIAVMIILLAVLVSGVSVSRHPAHAGCEHAVAIHRQDGPCGAESSQSVVLGLEKGVITTLCEHSRPAGARGARGGTRARGRTARPARASGARRVGTVR